MTRLIKSIGKASLTCIGLCLAIIDPMLGAMWQINHRHLKSSYGRRK